MKVSSSPLFKAFTHDLRSPIRGGDPVWDGNLPFRLPEVVVDQSDAECAAGWNACTEAAEALRIAGFWPDGYPVRLFRVEDVEGVVTRGDKTRFATATITAECDAAQIESAIRELSQKWFPPDHAEAMADEQIAWYRALGRPHRDETKVEAGLRAALNIRGLDWKLRQFRDARAARAALDAWTARDARAAWDTRDTWDTRDAWAARAARAALDALAAWDARDARVAWAAWDAWDAWAALSVQFAARMKWIDVYACDRLTVGIRDAFAHGLAVALPVARGILGYAMEEI
jgi:hypothetical protein